jgi:hypothetical protein
MLVNVFITVKNLLEKAIFPKTLVNIDQILGIIYTNDFHWQNISMEKTLVKT